MTIHELIKLAIKKLSAGTSPALDGEVLLSHVLDKPIEYLVANPEKKLRRELEKKFRVLLARRAEGWPVAYLNNQKEFYGLKFYVDKNVLVPRPETEELLDLVLKTIGSQGGLKILDIGTGAGVIIVSLAKKLGSKNRYFASDISPGALNVAKKNARLHKTRILFKQSDLLASWKNNFNVIIANLPYLARRTDPSTKFEPAGALIAANQGLKLYEELLKQVGSNNQQPRFVFLEIGHDQAPAIKKLAAKSLPAFETIISKDLSGRPRLAALVRLGSTVESRRAKKSA